MEEVQPSLKYATIKNQLIQAIIGEHFRLASETQAKIKLQSLEQQFIRSKYRPKDIAPETVFLWIKDFEVTLQQSANGYKGNFAAIYYKEVKISLRGGVTEYTLFAKKIDLELKLHPQQQRKKTSHPNWGIQFCAISKKGKIYPTLQDAQQDLQALHEEYPTTTIPLGNKLNIMVFSKLYEQSVKKFVLEIKPHENGFAIEIIEPNAGRKTSKPEQKEQVEPQGKFTAMIQLKRSKKKK